MLDCTLIIWAIVVLSNAYKVSQQITDATKNPDIKVITITVASGLDSGNNIKNAICQAIDNNILVVASSGNASRDNSCQINHIFPTKYNEDDYVCPGGTKIKDGLLVVGGTDREDTLAEWIKGSRPIDDSLPIDQQVYENIIGCSNTLYTDVYAPAENIYMASADKENLYTSRSGTSFAALAAAAAAVLWSAEPDSSVTEIHDRLLAGAQEFTDTTYGIDGKLLNLFLSLGGQYDDELGGALPFDTEIDPIAFNDIEDAPLSSQIISQSQRISGIDQSTSIRIENGFYSIDNGPFTQADSTIFNGEDLRIRVNTLAQPNETTTATVYFGDADNRQIATFQVTTGGMDVTLDNFDFADVENIAFNTLVESNIIRINGIDAGTEIRISGGLYSIDGGPFTSK